MCVVAVDEVVFFCRALPSTFFFRFCIVGYSVRQSVSRRMSKVGCCNDENGSK